MHIKILPIGCIVEGRIEAIDDNWGLVRSEIELDVTQFSSESLIGLKQFSHAEVIFFLHEISESMVEKRARHPRSRKNWPKVGIFSQRASRRPNRIGTTICRIISVLGRRVTVEGLDAIKGTPIIDIKPYISGFAPRGQIQEPEWSLEIMREYW